MKKFIVSLHLAAAFWIAITASKSQAEAPRYQIQFVNSSEDILIINDEKFEAKTWCIGWEKGDNVVFVEGSPYGACSSAQLYNIDKNKVCNVWCE